MTEEEKQLLFKDLVARLPYHVRVKVWLKDGDTEEGPLDLQHNYGDVLLDAFHYNKITKIKPYLRPMSSMTEEEINEYNKLVELDRSNKESFNNLRIEYIQNHPEYKNMPFVPMHRHIDYLNTHHFDYRGLIPMGLAIEASKDMYKN